MIEINQRDLDEINKTFKKIADIDKHKAFKEFAQNTYEDAISKADDHTDTGVLIKSIFLKKERDGYTIGSDRAIAPHAVFVHWGSKAHKIVHKNKQSLRFTKGNRFIFAKEVNHPGYKGDPFLLNALNDNIKRLPELFNRLTKDL